MMIKGCAGGAASIGWVLLSLLLLGCGQATESAGQGGAGGGGGSNGGVANSAGGGARAVDSNGGSTISARGGGRAVDSNGGATSGPAGGGRAGSPNGGVASSAGGGGSSGTAGAGPIGAGGSELKVGNLYVSEIRNTLVDKVDLLLMIDNSISMADKQAVLGDAMSALLSRLVTPLCVADGNPTGAQANASGACPTGAPEFPPIRDLHIGVVSSSLGAHGGQTCADAAGDDRGQLVPSIRQDPMYPVNTWNNGGFLFWDPAQKGTPPGQSVLPLLQTDFRNMVLAVGQSGCGFESSLEAWYRFLIDPEPITGTPAVTDPQAETQPTYDDNPNTNPVLRQRAQFLRPDSVVAIVMLSDENDCSIIDSGQGWLVGAQTLGGGTFRMPGSTSACAKNPNDKCCSSCIAGAVAGCPAPMDDASCKERISLTAPDDALNLRCYNQKERFGFDLLYPTDRYVNGLTQPEIPNRAGKLVKNPLFVNASGGAPRDRSLVFLAGIVGVPWQDLAVDPNAAQLRYKRYDAIDWSLLLGSPGDATTPPTPPGDKLMFETTADRTTLFGMQPHPVIGAAGALAPATATGLPNVINGHESNIRKGDDLQYACTFKLPQARPNCTGAGCDCDADGVDYNRSVCEGSTQTHARAYPGVRELRVLKDFGAVGTHNSIVGSICPKTLMSAKADPSYGYNPVVGALIEPMKEALTPKCLPRPLVLDPNQDGQVPCSITESSPPAAGQSCAPCDLAKGRSEPSAETRAAVLGRLKSTGACGGAGQSPCESLCSCDIKQYTGQELLFCQTAPSEPTGITPGFCYVDPSQATSGAVRTAQDLVVASCPAMQKRLLRFMGSDTPLAGSIRTIACTSSLTAQ